MRRGFWQQPELAVDLRSALPRNPRVMASLALKVPTHQTEFDLPQAADIRVNDPAPAMRSSLPP